MLRNKTKKMKSLGIWAAGLLLLSGLASCEKVIDVKLDSAEQKIVIDAVITDHEGDCVVKISKTKDFNEDNTFNGVSGATVSIKDDAGNVVPLTETSTGVFTHATLKGFPGKTYQLTVTADGKTFTSSSTMPQPVLLDSIYIKTQKFFDEDETFSNVVFTDPGGVKNYYRLVQYVNGEKTKGYFIMDDDLSDGKLFNTTLYFFEDDDKKKIKPGDMVKVDLLCIEQPVYKYWFSLDQSATGSSSSAAPSNPVSNISGDALGYFSAQVVSSLSIVAP